MEGKSNVKGDFLKALNYLIKADSQDSNKHKLVKIWFNNHFQTEGRASVVAEAKQAYNRIPEQFKHGDPHVIYVYKGAKTRDVLQTHVAQPKPIQTCKAFFLSRSTTKREASSAATFCFAMSLRVTKFYRRKLYPQISLSNFPSRQPKRLPTLDLPEPAVSQAGEDIHVAWALKVTAEDPCNLVSAWPSNSDRQSLRLRQANMSSLSVLPVLARPTSLHVYATN